MNEISLDGYVAGKTITARIVNAAGQYYYVAGTAFETYGASGHTGSDYAISMTDKGGGTYRGTFPTAITDAGEYLAYIWDSAITTQAVGLDKIIWDGTQETTLADLIEAHGSGAGDHAVTVTIRTTGGTAVPGVRVWLSTDNDRDNPVTGVYVTDDSGLTTFMLDYATRYYVHCHLAGYTFATAYFTPAAGSVAFVKDIATTALASGDESNYASALLVRAIAEIRRWSDEQKVSAKYSDDFLISRLENVYALVLAEKNRQMQDPAVATLSITPVLGTYVYIIPSTMGPIQAVYLQTDAYGPKWFYSRRGSLSQLGKGVWVEENMLRLQAGFDEIGETIYVDCIPNGCARLHCGTCTLNAAGDEATFGATPYMGTLDRAVNAYAGSKLRIFYVSGTTVTGNLIQERVITEYNAATRVATLAKALDPIPTTDDGYIFYEIAPQIPVGLDSVLATKVAWEICAVEMPKRAPGMLAIYNQNLRHLRLEAWCKQLPTAGMADADAVHNAGYEGNAW